MLSQTMTIRRRRCSAAPPLSLLQRRAALSRRFFSADAPMGAALCRRQLQRDDRHFQRQRPPATQRRGARASRFGRISDTPAARRAAIRARPLSAERRFARYRLVLTDILRS